MFILVEKTSNLPNHLFEILEFKMYGIFLFGGYTWSLNAVLFFSPNFSRGLARLQS